MKRTDVICIGNAAVDVPLYYVDERIFTTDSYMIERIVPMVGGSGLNVSTVLTHLGKKVKLCNMPSRCSALQKFSPTNACAARTT